jgi:DNA-binding response OmpR family regulator
MRVLLLEDEPEMASALRAALRAHDTVVDHVSSLLEAEEAIAVGHYGAILLDRQVPDGDGLSLIPKLRAQGLSVPVIVLTARGDVDDRICGLDTGADDYIAKPFVMDELLARLRAVMRRPQDMPSEILTFGRLFFDATSREVRIDGERMELPRRELLVLEALLRRIGRTVPRAALEEAVYGFDDEIQSNALDTHVSRLRRKLADAAAGLEIHPVRGIGYLLKHSP